MLFSNEIYEGCFSEKLIDIRGALNKKANDGFALERDIFDKEGRSRYGDALNVSNSGLRNVLANMEWFASLMMLSCHIKENSESHLKFSAQVDKVLKSISELLKYEVQYSTMVKNDASERSVVCYFSELEGEYMKLIDLLAECY